MDGYADQTPVVTYWRERALKAESRAKSANKICRRLRKQNATLRARVLRLIDKL